MYQPQYGVPQQGMQQQVPYGMPGIQAAAMAATAAASGSNYAYMHPDPNMPHSSPRLGETGAKKDNRQSPRMSNLAGRRMSQVTSPGISNASMMAHAGGRSGVAPPQMANAPAMQHPQSPELAAGGAEESPPLRECQAVSSDIEEKSCAPKAGGAAEAYFQGQKTILHESRHNHAMRRPRGPGGRFLTAEEVAAMEQTGKLPEGSKDADTASAKSSGSSGTKRKSDSGDGRPDKKAKTENGSQDNEGEDS